MSLIHTVKIDLHISLVQKHYTTLEQKLAALDSSHKNFHQKVLETICEVFPPNFIVIVGSNLNFNIQFLKNSLWIFSFDKAQVLLYRPRDFAFPQAQKMQRFSIEDKKKYLEENRDPELTDFKVNSNSLFSEEELKKLEEFIRLFYNAKRGDETELVKTLKAFLLFNHESLYLHIVIGAKDVISRVSSDITESRQFKANFKLRNTQKTMCLFIFEKQGEKEKMIERVFGRWKELLIFIVMCLLLVVLSGCSKSRTSFFGFDKELVCSQKDNLIWLLGGATLALVVAKHWKGKQKKKVL